MGWASGSDLFTEVIAVIKPAVKDKKARKKIYRKLISAFQDHDWDTCDECLGIDPVYDELYEEMFPEEDYE